MDDDVARLFNTWKLSDADRAKKAKEKREAEEKKHLSENPKPIKTKKTTGHDTKLKTPKELANEAIVSIAMVHIEGPRFLQEPPNWLDFTNSTGALIDCKATGVPQPTISWLDAVDNRVTDIPGLREVLTNGSLLLLPFGSAQNRNDLHATTYRCLASNSAGSILSRECKLRPEMLTDYQSSVENEYTVEGNVGVLKCRVRGGSNRIKVVNWLYQESTAGARKVITNGPKYIMTQSGSLHIASTTLKDAQDIFYCQTIHTLTGRRKLSSPGKIFLAADADKDSVPRIEHATTSVYAKLGEAVDLICSAYSTPPPTYRWYREINGIREEIRRGSMLIKPLESILRFTRVQRQDHGLYICVVTNLLGEDRKKLNLVVRMPLTVSVRPQSQVVDGGSEAQFNCSVEGGSGGHNLAWLKDGRPIHEEPRIQLLKNSEVLKIGNIHKDDGGMYQCLARTSDETEQSAAQLTLGALPPELKATFIEQTIQPGASVSLACQASGTPSPRISWYLDGSPVVPDESYMPFSYLHHMGDVISYLNITHSQVRHGGYYSCLAENSLGSVMHSASLNVYGPPTPRKPVNITAVYGGDKTLQCPIAGYPIMSTTWLSQGETLSNKHQIYNNGSLQLRNLDDSEDGGEYTCTVRNQQGQTARNFVYLKIMRPPEIQEFHFPSNLQEGNRAHVSCTVVSGDLPIEIIWLKDGNPMPHEPDVQEKNHQFVSGLLFSKLTSRHSGFYTCVARNAAAQTNFTSRLIVRVAPTWNIEPNDSSVLYQQSIFIHCQADGYPEPKVIWSKSKGTSAAGAIPIEPDPSSIEFAPNGTLIIHSASLQHKGHFTCEVDNGIGNPLRKTIFLMVNVPAYFRIHHINHNGVAGESLKLVCEAEGDLPMEIKWIESPNNKPLPAPHVRYTPTGLASELELHNVAPTDAGRYHCQVQNQFGSDSMTIHVSISEVPGAPKDFEVYDVGSRWVNVRWRAPEMSGSPLTQFIVQFREVHSDSVWSNLTVTGSTFSARLGTLLPSTEYELHIIAVNKVGTGPRSSEIKFKTQQEAPSSAPASLIAEANEPRTLLVKWKPFSESPGDTKDVSGYQVLYKEMGTSTRNIKTLKGHYKHQTKLHGLNQWAKYELSVRAFNHIGNGPESKPVVVTTLEGTPDAAPLNIRCVGVSSRTLKVMWEPPPANLHNGHIRGYSLLFKRVDRMRSKGMINVEMKKTENLEEFIHGLKPHTNYSVRVSAYTNAGDGIESDRYYCCTEEDVPGPPEQIKATVTSSASILLSWTEPVEPNGVIIKYNVYTQSKHEDPVVETVFGSKSLKYECRKLNENEKYDFWVTASTKIGEGSKTQIVSATPLARAPARIASFSSAVFGGAGSILTLQCHAVGLPAPKKHWKDPFGVEFQEPKDNFKDIGIGRKILSDNTMIINPLTPQHSGNYSCIAGNMFGLDSIMYRVVVITAPQPPEVAIMDVTTTTIDVQWKVSPADEPFLTEFVLHFKGPTNDWSRVVLEADQNHFRMKKLRCGTLYLISVQSVNEVGRSDKSNLNEVQTMGGLPSPGPPINEFLLINSSSIVLFLDVWPINGCPISYFIISYKELHHSDWIQVSGKVSPLEDFQINDLTPATRYKVHLEAFTDAGSYKHEYIFTTRTLAGDIIADESAVTTSSSFFSKNIIAPLVSVVVCVVIVCICLAVYLQKRYFRRAHSASKALVELENKRNDHQLGGHAYSPSPGRKALPSLSTHKGSDSSEICTTFSTEQMMSETTFNGRGIQTFLSREPFSGRDRNIDIDVNQDRSNYDIYPYATFSLPGQPATHSLRLKTFSQHGCYSSAPPPKDQQPISKYRSKATSKSPPDGLSLGMDYDYGERRRSRKSLRHKLYEEISCISSQQTLPIERKKSRDGPEVFGVRRGATSSFISDSESSGDRPYRFQHTPQKHLAETTLLELDSSTESAEMSPEIGWRSVMGRGVPSR